MASLPDWVRKYKKKGIYTWKSKNGYALYRGIQNAFRINPIRSFIVMYTWELSQRKMVLFSHVLWWNRGSKFCVTGFPVWWKLPAQFCKSICKNSVLICRTAVCSGDSWHWGERRYRGYASSYLSIMFPDLDIHKRLADEQNQHLAAMRR